MQYLLSQEELDNLVDKKWKVKALDLSIKVANLNKYSCAGGYGYCEGCPIEDECAKHHRYGK